MEGTAAPHPSPQRDRAIAGVATLLLLIGMPIGWLGSDTETGDVIGFIVATAISLGLMALLFLRVVPRVEAAGGDRPARTGLILAVIGAVTVAAFWTGLPFPLGASALALGLAGRELAPPGAGQGRATAAVVIGGLAVLLAFVGLLGG